MPAYIIAQINITDPQKYQEYAKLAGPATAKYGGKFLVRGGGKTELEGKIPYQRIVVTEYPSVEAATLLQLARVPGGALQAPGRRRFQHDRSRRRLTSSPAIRPSVAAESRPLPDR